MPGTCSKFIFSPSSIPSSFFSPRLLSEHAQDWDLRSYSFQMEKKFKKAMAFLPLPPPRLCWLQHGLQVNAFVCCIYERASANRAVCLPLANWSRLQCLAFPPVNKNNVTHIKLLPRGAVFIQPTTEPTCESRAPCWEKMADCYVGCCKEIKSDNMMKGFLCLTHQRITTFPETLLYLFSFAQTHAIVEALLLSSLALAKHRFYTK